VTRGDEKVNLLAGADEAVAGVVGVQHHEACRSDWIEWKADIHLCGLSFVSRIQLASVLVLVVEAHLLTVRQLSQLRMMRS